MKSKAKILVVDDNKGIRAALEMLLPRFFAQVEMLSSPKSLLSTIRELQPDVVLLDMNFQTAINTGNEGLYWLSEIKRFAPNIEVVLFTAYGDIQLAVEGMKRGASISSSSLGTITNSLRLLPLRTNRNLNAQARNLQPHRP